MRQQNTTPRTRALLVITRGQAAPLSNILSIMGYNVYGISMESHLGVIHIRECFSSPSPQFSRLLLNALFVLSVVRSSANPLTATADIRMETSVYPFQCFTSRPSFAQSTRRLCQLILHSLQKISNLKLPERGNRHKVTAKSTSCSEFMLRHTVGRKFNLRSMQAEYKTSMHVFVRWETSSSFWRIRESQHTKRKFIMLHRGWFVSAFQSIFSKWKTSVSTIH